MKKIITIVIFLILVISGIVAGSYLDRNDLKSEFNKQSDYIILTKPLIKEKEEYLFIELEESNSLLQSNGKPILPIITKKYVFPFGTKIKNIQATFSDIKEYNLPKKIAPAPSPVTRINDKEISSAINKENLAVYTGNTLYPSEQYDYSYHAGLEKGEHVVILNIQCYPIQYQPVDNKIYSAGKLEIDIEYEQPENPVVFTDEYDLVIIAPEIFSSSLQSLVDHKNSHGMKTKLKTAESIYDEYSGRDKPEQIKYFIKDAVEDWDISYVLLVGGKKSLWTGNWGIEGPRDLNDELWHCPVRYNTLEDSYEQGVLTDLYFADIYKYDGEEIVFEDWDSDGNDWFGEWTLDRKDTLDMYPDVNVGRLVCRNKKEVQIMVDKIITYESDGTDPSWFNKIVGIGGDSFDDRPPLGDDYFEGEERNKLAAEYLGFDFVKIWTSQKNTGEPVPTRAEITRAINDGCGFLYFAGHGATALFRTYWYQDWSHGNATEPFDIYDMMFLKNGEKLPICVVGACHNSEFNVSFFNFIKSHYDYYPTPECWSWVLTRKIGGGSIATIGYTGLEWVATYGWDDDDIPDCTQYFSGYLDSRFFHAYGVDGVENIGACWSQAITEYLDKTPGRSRWDIKTPAQWFLMGDPSLKIGGYT